jgi:hypothetical protein
MLILKGVGGTRTQLEYRQQILIYFSFFFGLVVVVWTSLGPLPWWVPGPTTRWALGTTRLHTAPDGVGRKDYGGEVLG